MPPPTDWLTIPGQVDLPQAAIAMGLYTRIAQKRWGLVVATNLRRYRLPARGPRGSQQNCARAMEAALAIRDIARRYDQARRLMAESIHRN